jgi:hypothetical protein
MPVAERRGRHPRLEGGDVAPAGEHEPCATAIGGAKQLEAFEPLGVIDGPGPFPEPPGQLAAALSRDGDRVDSNDAHELIMAEGGPTPPLTSMRAPGARCDASPDQGGTQTV